MSVTNQSLRPPHPIAECVTWELRDYRRHLERTLSLPTLPPNLRLPREELQKRLDEVVAEESERERIRHAKPESANAQP